MLDSTTKTFLRRVVAHFKPYYAGADKAHGLSHVLRVCFLALKINKKLNITKREDLIILAAIAHDMFSFTHREIHHIEASRYLSTTEDPIIANLPLSDIIMLSQAVLEHRASFKGQYWGWLSELISAADRGVPNLSSITKRVYICSKDTRLVFNTDDMQLTDDSGEELFLQRTLIHLRKKYGKDGYARYNKIYIKMFSAELKDMQAKIEVLNIEDIKNIINSN